MLGLLLALAAGLTWDDVGTPASEVAARFNLVCSGTLMSGKLGQWGMDSQRPFSQTYRVDLAHKRWCTEECRTTSSIVEITPQKILFEREERGELNDTITFVNRENGAYESRLRSGLIGSEVFVVVMQGTCKRAPFTGFPAQRF
jgi:hypothetical protein